MNELPLSKRLPWLLAVIAVQSVYFPTSQAASGGILPKLSIDVIPVYPVWIVPYYFTYFFWLFAIYWSLYKMDDRSFRAFVAGALFTVSIGAATFVFFPTYIELPTVSGNDIFSEALRFIQVAGGAHAALPSAHNYVTMLIVAFACRLYPRQTWLWISILVAIALSTLFTGQHYILDVVTGLALGWLGYKFGWTFIERRERELAPDRPS
ncbi:MAG: phosphatase PAP2 family protein [Chloroflexota bacterium]